MGHKDHLVVGDIRVDCQERHLVQAEGEVRASRVVVADLAQVVHEVFEQNTHQLMGYGLVGDEHLQSAKDVRVGNRLIDEEIHVTCPYLGEDVRLELQQDLGQQLHRFLGFSGIAIALEYRQTSQRVLEEFAQLIPFRRRRRIVPLASSGEERAERVEQCLEKELGLCDAVIS